MGRVRAIDNQLGEQVLPIVQKLRCHNTKESDKDTEWAPSGEILSNSPEKWEQKTICCVRNIESW